MAMQGGAGDYSYSRNSNMQAASFQIVASAIAEAIRDNSAVFSDNKLIRIADIGCSSGRNTLTSVEFVMKEITGLQHLKDSQIVFQVLFSDLASNDFNTLFKLIADERNISQGRPYFYAAVPGSFSERLFPASSIHFSMSNFALQILSKAPAVANPGRVLVDNRSSPHIIAAYEHQAHEDLCSFLNHRAEEIVPGGILSCFMFGNMSPDERPSPWFDLFEKAWKELVAEGLISQDCLDSFNLLGYRRTLNEVQKALEACKECFKAIRVEHTPMKTPDPKGKAYYVTLSRGFKAVTRPAVVEHFKGDEKLTEVLYEKVDEKIAAGIPSFPQAEYHLTIITLVLLRL